MPGNIKNKRCLTNTFRVIMPRAAVLFFTSLLLILSTGGFAQITIPLYADSIPNSVARPDSEYTEARSRQIMNVSRPTLTRYLPAKNKITGEALIICPGGGYGSLVIDREGHDVARAFSKKGIACFVLKYRLPGSNAVLDRTIAPLQDAQRAIKYVREHASDININTGRIGILGFSAGGHLASSAGTLFGKAVIDNKEGTSLRPDFMVLVYPVISMDTLTGHKGSTFNLLGDQPTTAQIQEYSTDLRVSKGTPPAFITVAADDDLLGNSLLFFNALHSQKIPAELHVYAHGGHGYLKYPSFEEWAERCTNWMKTLSLK